ncbi:MAG TPA: hypothetical protein VEB64_09110 [Azospirillaceae bacterium]|nr:hypothetical protein [Azospirillaceae bacterium]
MNDTAEPALRAMAGRIALWLAGLDPVVRDREIRELAAECVEDAVSRGIERKRAEEAAAKLSTLVRDALLALAICGGAVPGRA